MKASIIIPVWNGRRHLPACLDALLAQDYPDFEIIVVDNASTDGSPDLIARNYPQVRLFRNAQNLGFAGACNIGMRAAIGDIFVLLNQDTFFGREWVSELVRAFTETDAGVVGCKILSAFDHSLQHAGGSVHKVLGVPFHIGKDEPYDQGLEAPREVDYVTGAAMAIHRCVVEQVGLLDERFLPAYYEDVDFCFRVRAAGYKVLYWPRAIVFHHESTSTPERVRLFYFQRGRIRFVLKHWPLDLLITQFAEAEGGFQVEFARRHGSTWPLRLAYSLALLELPAIAAERRLCNGELLQIVNTLKRLHIRALALDFAKAYDPDNLWQVISALLDEPTLRYGLQNSMPKIPELREVEFRSSVPILGKVITAFRWLCYTISAKWAIRDLIEQQRSVNQCLVEHISRLENRISVMNRFFLKTIVEAEIEAVFSLLWPLRWDLVLDLPSSFGGCSNE